MSTYSIKRLWSHVNPKIGKLPIRMALRAKFAFHPLTFFLITIALCVAVIVLWVFSYQNQSETLDVITSQTGFKGFDLDIPVTLLIAGCLLLGSILLSTVALFLFYAHKAKMYHEQQAFVSSVTHELRSPIASIQLALETLKSRELPLTVSKKMHTMMHDDIDRLKHLVERILISNRFDQGFASFEETEFIDLGELINNISSKLLHTDSQITKRLKVTIDKVPIFQSSKDALSLILSNLLENAVKYSPANTPIFINATLHKANLYIEVKDQGIGLSKKDQKKIFKLFYRSPDHRRTAIKGTGIGLHIVNLAAKKLSGKVRVYSQGKNLGTTFSVRLPIKHKEAFLGE